MKQIRTLTSIILPLLLVFMVGCAATQTSESTGEYIDDSVITSKVKLAILNEATLSTAEINVETFKGVVQLSGFASSSADTRKAVSVAQSIAGVKSVKNDMRVK